VVVHARQGAGEQEYDEDDDHKADDATESGPTPSAVAIVAAAAEHEINRTIGRSVNMGYSPSLVALWINDKSSP
jgi:hypothetical protein